jgi:hypothetical protein
VAGAAQRGHRGYRTINPDADMPLDLQSTDDARRARRALGTLAWVPLALGAVWVGTELAQQRLWAAIGEDGLTRDSVGRWLQLVNRTHLAASVAATITLIVSCARLRLRPHWLAASVAGAFGLVLLHSVLVQVHLFDQDFEGVRDLRWAGRIASVLAWTSLGTALLLAGPRRPLDRALAGVAIAVPIGLALLYTAMDRQSINSQWLADNPMVWWSIYAAITFTQMGALFALARRASAAAPQPTAGDEWRAAARGLHLFASAILARVVIVFCVVMLLILATMSRSLGLLKLTLVALPLASVAAGAVAAAGMAGYAHLPYLENVRRAARLVFVLVCAGLVLDGVALHAALTAVLGDPGRFFELDRDLMRHIELGSQLAGFTAVIALLLAMRATAAHIARPEMGVTASALLPPVILVVGGGIALRHHAATGSLERDLGAILLMLAAIANLVVLLAFAKAAHRLSAAMGDSAVPSPARASYREPRSG